MSRVTMERAWSLSATCPRMLLRISAVGRLKSSVSAAAARIRSGSVTSESM